MKPFSWTLYPACSLPSWPNRVPQTTTLRATKRNVRMQCAYTLTAAYRQQDPNGSAGLSSVRTAANPLTVSATRMRIDPRDVGSTRCSAAAFG